VSRVTTHCRLCGNEALRPVVNLGRQPLSGVFPRPEAADPTASPLELVRCDTAARADACGLVQLRHSAEVAEMYGATYGYFSSISPTMVSHLQGIAGRVLDAVRPAPGDVVLDIGCNDGTLLNLFGGRGLTRIGMDPSSRKFAARFQPDIRVTYDFFSEAGARAMIQRGLALDGRSISDERLTALFSDFLQHYGENLAVRTRLFPGAEGALLRLAQAGR
jgi:NDP-4-keto-2,6-dideoxyhexose 3-C-methyltransferase